MSGLIICVVVTQISRFLKGNYGKYVVDVLINFNNVLICFALFLLQANLIYPNVNFMF